jgi:transposase
MNTATQPPAIKVKAKRRHYDEQFKRDAVALLAGGRGATQLARELGVSQWNLRDWRALYGAGANAGSPPAHPAAGAGAAELAVQLADLRRELAAVTGQRDLLKKALAIVAQEPLSATR